METYTVNIMVKKATFQGTEHTKTINFCNVP